MVRWTLERGLLAALLVLCSVPLSLGVSASLGELSAHAQGAVIQSIVIEGNRRVEPETVRSYLTFSSGDAYDPAEINQSLKTLFATGLFQDVRIRRQGATIIVIVIENPIVNQVAFEGNEDVEDETLVNRRLDTLKNDISTAWEELNCCYELVIEPEIFWRLGGPPGKSEEAGR